MRVGCRYCRNGLDAQMNEQLESKNDHPHPRNKPNANLCSIDVAIVQALKNGCKSAQRTGTVASVARGIGMLLRLVHLVDMEPLASPSASRAHVLAARG